MQPGAGPGPVRQRLDAMREVVPLVFGSMGETTDSVRQLAKAAAQVAVRSRSCRADFNIDASSDEDQAAGVLSWYLLRRWGRLAILRGLYVKETALQQVAGTQQARERQHRDASGCDGVTDEFWYQRGSREDGGQSFMGFGAGLGVHGFGDRND